MVRQSTNPPHTVVVLVVRAISAADRLPLIGLAVSPLAVTMVVAVVPLAGMKPSNPALLVPLASCLFGSTHNVETRSH